MKQVCVKADDSQTITAIYEFLHDLDNEYSNFSKWYYSTVVPGLASENRIIYTVLDDGKIVAVLILKDSDEKKICTLRVAEHYRCQGIATKLLKIAHQALRNKGRESPRFQPWDDRPTIMVFFVFANAAQESHDFNRGRCQNVQIHSLPFHQFISTNLNFC